MIRYTFTFAQGEPWSYAVDETRGLAQQKDSGPDKQTQATQKPPDWMRLDRHRCAFCTLQDDRQSCPAAQAIAPAVEAFASRISYEDVQLRVELRGLEIQVKTQAQEALRSLIGLLLPLSDCPVMRRLRPMARFHEPLASPEMTVFRVFGMYLVQQFLRGRDGEQPDWQLQQLLELYKQIHEVNVQLAERLREMSSADANINGVTLLDVLAYAVDFGFEKSEKQLRQLFEDQA